MSFVSRRESVLEMVEKLWSEGRHLYYYADETVQFEPMMVAAKATALSRGYSKLKYLACDVHRNWRLLWFEVVQ